MSRSPVFVLSIFSYFSGLSRIPRRVEMEFMPDILHPRKAGNYSPLPRREFITARYTSMPPTATRASTATTI